MALHTRLLRYVGRGLALLLWWGGTGVQAGEPARQPSWAGLASWSLPRGAVQTEVARQATLYGAPAQITYYEAPLSVSDMIVHFQRHHPDLRDLTVMQGMAVLSDRHGKCRRTATVTGVGRMRSAGTLSRVCWGEAPDHAALAPQWLPEGARLVFDFSTRESTGNHRQQIWRHSSTPEAVRVGLRRRLLHMGWTPAAQEASGTQQWVRAAEVMSIDVVAAGTESVIVIGLQAAAPMSAAAPARALGPGSVVPSGERR